MYTGIVQATATVTAVTPHSGHTAITLANAGEIFDDAQIGASISIDGTCLTVTAQSAGTASFDISAHTAKLTTLSALKVGDIVNIERSHKSSMENGGHNLYGHTHGTATITAWDTIGHTAHVTIALNPDAIPYFFPKGFIGLHGCSLTVDDVDEARSQVSLNLIPETLRLTTFKQKQIGDLLNYEIDQTTRTIVDTIQRTMRSQDRGIGAQHH